MRIDREKLRALTALDDNALWQEILRIGRGFNLNLPSTTPKKEEMQKIRDMLDEGKINPHAAMKIMQGVRRDSENGR